MAKKMRYSLQTDGVYSHTLEKYAPSPPASVRWQDQGTWWDLTDRAAAIAMRERVLAAFPKSGARVYEMPADYEEDGDEDWILSRDALTLVLGEKGAR
jgi:hypothetical protein